MSHFTKLKTRLNDLNCLEKALKDLKLNYKIANKNEKIILHGYYGTRKVDILLKTSEHGSNYNVGLIKKKDGIYELVGDFMNFRVKHENNLLLNQTKFSNVLRQLHDKHKTLNACRKQRKSVKSVIYDSKNQRYVIKVRR
ncbi:MAG: DUF1257 domain-containing protein [Candidatus Lokiarchaeota archaeon]|nr:DUF1257 domain-containing protein [Candidatus Lokiarchaeota archaeon]